MEVIVWGGGGILLEKGVSELPFPIGETNKKPSDKVLQLCRI